MGARDLSCSGPVVLTGHVRWGGGGDVRLAAAPKGQLFGLPLRIRWCIWFSLFNTEAPRTFLFVLSATQAVGRQARLGLSGRLTPDPLRSIECEAC